MKGIILPNKSKELRKIFDFLQDEKNRKFNKQVQEGFLKDWVNPSLQKSNDNIYNLLFEIVNTQSQPKLNKISIFLKHTERNRNHLSSFKGFNDKVINNNEASFKSMFDKLKQQNGWGKKTSALFVKTIYEIHNGRYQSFKIWSDVPNLIEGDKIYLPVDQVIEKIFESIYKKKLSFDKINSILQSTYPQPKDMIIWDDLWYWGFITQKGAGKNRTFTKFNDEKYWCMKNSTKNEKEISIIKEKCTQFLELIK